MNGRQAAKAAAKRIEELEYANSRYAKDIRLFYKCIIGVMNHNSPCKYCEDLEECRAAGKDLETGCDEWILNSDMEEESDAGKGVHAVGSESGE